jgi:hypothetical protein
MCAHAVASVQCGAAPYSTVGAAPCLDPPGVLMRMGDAPARSIVDARHGGDHRAVAARVRAAQRRGEEATEVAWEVALTLVAQHAGLVRCPARPLRLGRPFDD